jgi:hypothetical protein
MYDHRNKSNVSVYEAQKNVGKQATLPLTGEIVDCGESLAGVWVRFRVDERWGYPPGFTIRTDMDALDIDEGGPSNNEKDAQASLGRHEKAVRTARSRSTDDR